MGLLQKLKSALGLDGSNSTASTAADVDVTVEREPSTEDEDAVKGTNTATTEVGTAEGDASEAVPDTGVETDADTETDVEATAETATADDAAPAEDDPVIDEAEPGDEDDDTAEPAGADAAGEPDAAAEGSDDPVTEIKGIGPAYAERLADIGIETVGDLAAADAADIAAETDLSESRIAGWVEQAAAY